MLINNKSLIKTINKLNLTDDEREKYLSRQKLDGLMSMWQGTNNIKNTEGMGIYKNKLNGAKLC